MRHTFSQSTPTSSSCRAGRAECLHAIDLCAGSQHLWFASAMQEEVLEDCLGLVDAPSFRKFAPTKCRCHAGRAEGLLEMDLRTASRYLQPESATQEEVTEDYLGLVDAPSCHKSALAKCRCQHK
ncbi:hypothetical protein HAX54_026149 [Datura stramonium]|uniref:Uncharacterized protein n=1 Tax=Datura stramonium TaxID=4076 RepID=A0ABS8V2X1_DATST|nr:hypothetical protein [Datura stramonium]